MAPGRPDEDQRGGPVLNAVAPESSAGSGPNPFSYLARNAEQNPRGVFVETPENRLLNSEALVLVKQIAYELRRLGVLPGDMVALDLPEFIRILFTEALFHEAAGTTVLPAGYSADGIFRIDWIFSSADALPQQDARMVTVDPGFLERVEQNPFGISPREYPSAETALRVSFSSGTTGRPNAIALTIGMTNGASSNDVASESWLRGDPLLLLLDTATPSGFNAFYVSVRDGRPFLAVGGYDYAAVASLAMRASVTVIQGAPVQFERFVAELESRGQRLPSVGTVFGIGTVMPPPLADRLRAAFDGCLVYNIYGSTEATLAAARFYESDDPFDAGTIFPGSTVQIVDDVGNVLPDGEIGRIRHRHPQMAHGYLGDPEATSASFQDDWFYPGDLGKFRADGGLTLAGRSSDILNAGGVKVDPNQLDLLAKSYLGVEDACSFTYTAANGLQQIGIALVADKALDIQALIKQFANTFGAAAPSLVGRVDAIPRTATGKPLRRDLSEMFKES